MSKATRPIHDDQSGANFATRYEELKQMLLTRQRELLNELHGKIRNVRDEGSQQDRVGLDPGDMSEAEIQDDLEFVLIQMKAETANKISDALARLEEGRYGLCFECGEQIAPQRLRALPFAVRCKDCEETIEMAQQRDRARSRRGSSPLGFEKVGRMLHLVLAFALLATPALAQTPAPTSGTDASGQQPPSAAAMAQEAANPFSSRWLLQTQQNNNLIEMPGSDNRVQSNLMFQPLLSVPLAEQWGLYVRPVLTIVNSVPHPDQRGQAERTTGFGDTVLGIAAARPLFNGRLMVGLGPTFIFPTASEQTLGQDTWQFGPDLGATLLGKHFIAYGFVQQWFKFGGNGRETNQMNGVFNFTYTFANGWTLGTQPNLSVDWQADGGDQGTFSIGPQVGKICTCGGIPTLMQVQFEYYPVRPSGAAPKWNIQLQVTPTIPALIKKALF